MALKNVRSRLRRRTRVKYAATVDSSSALGTPHAKSASTALENTKPFDVAA